MKPSLIYGYCLSIFVIVVKVIGILIATIDIDSCSNSSDSNSDLDFSLATWLFVYSILGLIVAVIALCLVSLGRKIAKLDNDMPAGHICACFGFVVVAILVAMYLIFSLGWNIYGITGLFGRFAPCRDNSPYLWGYSLFNCILLYVVMVFNPGTASIARKFYKRCRHRPNITYV